VVRVVVSDDHRVEAIGGHGAEELEKPREGAIA
jgi:hypothetical protein